MAKINHEKHNRNVNHYNKDYSNDIENQYTHEEIRTKWRNEVWECKGKYCGKYRLIDLPEYYLKWVLNNFDEGSLYWEKAKFELECRYNLL